MKQAPQHAPLAPQDTRQLQACATCNAGALSAEPPVESAFDTSPRQLAQRELIQHMQGGTVQAKPANTTGLPDALKAGVESLSGMSLDHVQVNYNSSQPAQLNAHAFAQGQSIHVAPGQEKHLPHEAWHVVQQAQGRVRPTVQMKGGVPVNDDRGLEHEADVMGARALQMHAPTQPENTAQRRAISTGSSAPVQLLGGQDLVDIKIFFDREIASIGSPTAPKHRALLQEAQNDPNLLTAKQRIRAFIRNWHQGLDAELVGEEDPEERYALRDERYIPTGEKSPISSVDIASVVGSKSPRKPPPPSGDKSLGHLPYTSIKGMDTSSKLHTASRLAEDSGTTPIELEKRANTQMLHRLGVLDHIDRLAQIVRMDPSFAAKIKADDSLSLGGLVGVYYRYHKFGNSDRSGLVFGGGFNKSDIDSDVPHTDPRGKPPLHGKSMKKHFTDRHKALTTLSTGTPGKKAKTLEDAQANAFSTPFIATTETPLYAEELLTDYPPDVGQYAVMLTILGPSMNTLNFESEFAALKMGPKENNFRSKPERAKDKDQAEFGIPDIFIPIGTRSPLGFVIAHVERLT